MTRVKKSRKKEALLKPEKFDEKMDTPMGPLTNQNQNQNHNVIKEAQGQNTKR